MQSCKACSWLPSKRLDPESGIFSGIVTKIWLQNLLQWSELNWLVGRAFWSYAHRTYAERQGFVEVWSFIQHLGQDWGPRNGMLRALTEGMTEKSLHSTSIGRDRCCGILLRSEFCNTQQPGSPSSKREDSRKNNDGILRHDKHGKLPNSHLWPMHHWSTWADGWAVFPITQHLLFQSFFTLLAIWVRFSKTYCNLQSPVRFSNSVRRHWGL